jgi:hypothetical protein
VPTVSQFFGMMFWREHAPAAPWRVVAVTVLPGHRLALRFHDGTEGLADLSQLVTAPDAGFYAGLADPRVFAAVRLEIGVPCWPNGADLDPCWLYDEARAGREWRA